MMFQCLVARPTLLMVSRRSRADHQTLRPSVRANGSQDGYAGVGAEWWRGRWAIPVDLCDHLIRLTTSSPQWSAPLARQGQAAGRSGSGGVTMAASSSMISRLTVIETVGDDHRSLAWNSLLREPQLVSLMGITMRATMTPTSVFGIKQPSRRPAACRVLRRTTPGCSRSAIGTAATNSSKRLVCGYPHDATRPVPNLNGRSHTEVQFCPFSHVIVRLGDEAVRLGDAIVLI
jgi:hypothetical protein